MVMSIGWVILVSCGVELAGFDDVGDEGAGEAVAEIAIIGGVEDEEVGLFAGFDGADEIILGEGFGGVDGGGGDGLGGCHFHLTAGEGDDEGHVFTPGGARVAVGGEGEIGVGLDEGFGGGIFGLGEAKGGAGKADGDCFGLGESEDVLLASFDHVVGRGGVELGGEGGPSEIFKFVDVDFEREAKLFGFGEDGTGLF